MEIDANIKKYIDNALGNIQNELKHYIEEFTKEFSKEHLENRVKKILKYEGDTDQKYARELTTIKSTEGLSGEEKEEQCALNMEAKALKIREKNTEKDVLDEVDFYNKNLESIKDNNKIDLFKNVDYKSFMSRETKTIEQPKQIYVLGDVIIDVDPIESLHLYKPKQYIISLDSRGSFIFNNDYFTKVEDIEVITDNLSITTKLSALHQKKISCKRIIYYKTQMSNIPKISSVNNELIPWAESYNTNLGNFPEYNFETLILVNSYVPAPKKPLSIKNLAIINTTIPKFNLCLIPNLTRLCLVNVGLTQLTGLPTGLIELNISDNFLSEMPVIPYSTQVLIARNTFRYKELTNNEGVIDTKIIPYDCGLEIQQLCPTEKSSDFIANDLTKSNLRYLDIGNNELFSLSYISSLKRFLLNDIDNEWILSPNEYDSKNKLRNYEQEELQQKIDEISNEFTEIITKLSIKNEINNQKPIEYNLYDIAYVNEEDIKDVDPELKSTIKLQITKINNLRNKYMNASKSKLELMKQAFIVEYDLFNNNSDESDRILLKKWEKYQDLLSQPNNEINFSKLKLTNLIIDRTAVNELDISNTDIEYFDCSYCLNIKLIIPTTLKTFICAKCNLKELPSLGSNITYLDINTNKLKLIDFDCNLSYFDCSSNKLNSIPNINISDYFSCSANPISKLNDELLKSISYFDARHCSLTELPTITENMKSYFVSGNEILLTDTDVMNIDLKNIVETDLQNLDIFLSGEVDIHKNSKLYYALRERKIIMKNIFDDPQNAHDPIIGECTRKAIQYLYLKHKNTPLDSNIIFKNALNSGVNGTDLSIQTGRSDTYKLVFDNGEEDYLSYTDIFELFWLSAMEFDTNTKIELAKIFNNVIHDLRGICDERAYIDTINCLGGFDPNINIRPNEKAMAQAVYNVVYKRITETYTNLNEDDMQTILKRELKKEFEERQFSKNIIDIYTNF